MYYGTGHNADSFCEWKRITEQDKTLRVVIDFVRTLKGWEHCILCGFMKFGQNKGDQAKAFFYKV